jgi:hypothetical protein
VIFHAGIQGHRDLFANERWILPEIVQHDGAQTLKRLAADVAVEVDLQTELGRIPAAAAARPDADVLLLDAVPRHVGGIVGVEVVVLAQLDQVARTHEYPQLVDDAAVEHLDRRRLRGRRWCLPAGRAGGDERQ